MDQLVTCRSCAVHVRMSEPSCPFCGASAPSQSLESGPRARTSRAGLHRLHAAAMATCAIACDHGQSASTVTIAPAASSAPEVTATATATSTVTTTVTATATATATPTATVTATATATASKHLAGASCATNNDCATGLSCCATGMTGACGGRARQMNAQPPCVTSSTCVAGPCTPMAMPPYGGAFPDDGSLTV